MKKSKKLKFLYFYRKYYSSNTLRTVITPITKIHLKLSAFVDLEKKLEPIFELKAAKLLCCFVSFQYKMTPYFMEKLFLNMIQHNSHE